jgi:hypothetical protein
MVQLSLCFLALLIATSTTAFSFNQPSFDIIDNDDYETSKKLPCEFPEQFSVVGGLLALDQTTEKYDTFASVSVFFDYPMQRMRADISGNKKGKPVNKSLWLLFKESKMLRLDRDEKKCYKDSLQGKKLHKPEIPKGSKFITYFEKGSTVAEVWKLKPTKRDDHSLWSSNHHLSNTTIVVEIETGTCIPLNAVALNVTKKNNNDDGEKKYEILMTIGYANWNYGIPPNMFDVPVQCGKVEEEGDTWGDDGGDDNVDSEWADLIPLFPFLE